MGASGLVQIGEVAERTGLSLRTIRYYEEVGLVVPSARSQGGFRLYTGADIERLQLIKRMKPLELALDETRELLQVIDRLESGARLTAKERERLATVLRGYRDRVRERCASLRAVLATAQQVDRDLASHLDALAAQPARAGSVT